MRKKIRYKINLISCMILSISFIGNASIVFAESNFTEQPRGFSDPLFKARNDSEFIDNDCGSSGDSSKSSTSSADTSSEDGKDAWIVGDSITVMTATKYHNKTSSDVEYHAENASDGELKEMRIDAYGGKAFKTPGDPWGYDTIMDGLDSDIPDKKKVLIIGTISNGEIKPEDFARVIKKAHDKGMKVVTFTMYIDTDKANAEYNRIYPINNELVKKSDADIIIDWESVVKKNKDTPNFLVDFIHPGDAGQKELVSLVKEGIVKAKNNEKGMIGGDGTTTVGGGVDSSSQQCCSKPKISISGEDNPAKIMSYLVGKGFSGAQAAGILGNVMRESNGQTNLTSKDGHGSKGIVQWTGKRESNLYAYAKTQNKNFEEIEVQIGFLGVELGIEGDESNPGYGSEKDTAEALKKVEGNDEDAARKAAEVFENKFERSEDGINGSTHSNNTPGMEMRRNFAAEAFSKYGGSSSFSSSSSSGGSCSKGKESTNGEFVYYAQYDPQWQKDGLDIHGSGCGPTSLAMVISTIKKDKSITPVTVAKKARDMGIWNNNGFPFNGYEKMAKEFDVNYKEIDRNEIKSALEDGKLLILAGSGGVDVGGHTLYRNGHIVAASGITGDGQIVVQDPGSNDGKDKKMPESDVINGLIHAYAFSN